MDLPVQNGGQQAAAKVGRKAETCRLLTNLSLVEFNLGNHESSFYFSALAVGLGHNRFKALFRDPIQKKHFSLISRLSFGLRFQTLSSLHIHVTPSKRNLKIRLELKMFLLNRAPGSPRL